MKEATLLDDCYWAVLLHFFPTIKSSFIDKSKPPPTYNLLDYVEDVYPFLSGTNAL